MNHQYYIESGSGKDGPHDLVTIMRRIRARKITADTPIYIDDADSSARASDIPDIALFFSKNELEESQGKADQVQVSLRTVLRESWRFTYDHNIITVFAGGMALLIILLAAALTSTLGPYLGGTLSWIIFMQCHYLFFVCALRVYRMQPFSVDFFNSQLGPVLGVLLFAAFVNALMMVGGFILLVIPSIVVAVYYIFAPFFIYDRRMSMIEAMVASRLLVQKHNRRYQKIFAVLVLMYLGSLILIFPVPVTLPIFAITLARVYDELSIS